MGILSDLLTLSRQGRALAGGRPVHEQLASASAQLATVSAMVEQHAQQSRGGQRILMHGVDAVALVVGARRLPVTMQLDPMVDLDLVVTMPTGAQVPVRRTEVVALLHLARVQVGARLWVRADPRDPQTLWIDWAAPPP